MMTHGVTKRQSTLVKLIVFASKTHDLVIAKTIKICIDYPRHPCYPLQEGYALTHFFIILCFCISFYFATK